jgi:hypothetical protein
MGIVVLNRVRSISKALFNEGSGALILLPLNEFLAETGFLSSFHAPPQVGKEVL